MRSEDKYIPWTWSWWGKGKRACVEKSWGSLGRGQIYWGGVIIRLSRSIDKVIKECGLLWSSRSETVALGPMLLCSRHLLYVIMAKSGVCWPSEIMIGGMGTPMGTPTKTNMSNHQHPTPNTHPAKAISIKKRKIDLICYQPNRSSQKRSFVLKKANHKTLRETSTLAMSPLSSKIDQNLEAQESHISETTLGGRSSVGNFPVVPGIWPRHFVK